MSKNEADGGDLSGMNVFQFFYLLCSYYIITVFLLYSTFLSWFFNENPILLVADDL